MSMELRHGDANTIPAAPFYVLSNDKFMSGWGYARNAINTIVLPCGSYEEAEKVAAYARSRSEQRRIRICGSKPRLRRGVLYSVVSRDDYSRWYGID